MQFDYSPLRITRVPPPAWPHHVHGEDELALANQLLGGQAEWHFGVPWLFRAIASPGTYERVLAAPTQPYDPDVPVTGYHRAGYWAGLLYLLNFRLGWALPAQGLAMWAEAGFSEDDPTLRLVKAVWVRDGRLDDMLGWDVAWRPSGPLGELGWRPVGRLGAAVDPARYAWARVPEFGPAGCHLVPFGGHSPVALDDDERTSTAQLLRTSTKERRAVLHSDSMVGWYGALRRLGGELPKTGPNSWRVDVVVSPVGHLGTFRRSRDTNLWFTGKHSTHVLGN